VSWSSGQADGVVDVAAHTVRDAAAAMGGRCTRPDSRRGLAPRHFQSRSGCSICLRWGLVIRAG